MAKEKKNLKRYEEQELLTNYFPKSKYYLGVKILDIVYSLTILALVVVLMVKIVPTIIDTIKNLSGLMDGAAGMNEDTMNSVEDSMEGTKKILEMTALYLPILITLIMSSLLFVKGFLKKKLQIFMPLGYLGETEHKTKIKLMYTNYKNYDRGDRKKANILLSTAYVKNENKGKKTLIVFTVLTFVLGVYCSVSAYLFTRNIFNLSADMISLSEESSMTTIIMDVLEKSLINVYSIMFIATLVLYIVTQIVYKLVFIKNRNKWASSIDVGYSTSN